MPQFVAVHLPDSLVIATFYADTQHEADNKLIAIADHHDFEVTDLAATELEPDND